MISHRFNNIKIEEITIENHTELLPESFVKQVSIFLPPDGSFDTKCLQRYLENVKNY